MLDQTSGLDQNSGRDDIIVKDAFIGQYPDFERMQASYRGVGKTLVTLMKRTEGIGFKPQEVEIIERMFGAMSVVDHMIDIMKLEKSHIIEMVVNANSPAISFNKSLSHLHQLIKKNGDYSAYLASATRAISYSGNDSMEDRHREALYLGKAIAMAVCKDDTPKRNRLIADLGILTSIGSFVDDVMDYKKDEKDLSWATERMMAVVRNVRKLYATSEHANRYFITEALTGFTLYGRRLLRDSLK